MERGFREVPEIAPRGITLEQRAEQDLLEMARQNPDLRQYVSIDSITRAKDVLQSVRRMLRINPKFFERVSQALALTASENPGKTVVAVYANSPLVFMQTPTGNLEGFVPVLGCTYHALDDLDQPDDGPSIVISNNDLIPHVQERLESNSNPIISYNRNSMNPGDYIALAANHFQNETFRFRIQGDQLMSP